MIGSGVAFDPDRAECVWLLAFGSGIFVARPHHQDMELIAWSNEERAKHTVASACRRRGRGGPSLSWRHGASPGASLIHNCILRRMSFRHQAQAACLLGFAGGCEQWAFAACGAAVCARSRVASWSLPPAICHGSCLGDWLGGALACWRALTLRALGCVEPCGPWLAGQSRRWPWSAPGCVGPWGLLVCFAGAGRSGCCSHPIGTHRQSAARCVCPSVSGGGFCGAGSVLLGWALVASVFLLCGLCPWSMWPWCCFVPAGVVSGGFAPHLVLPSPVRAAVGTRLTRRLNLPKYLRPAREKESASVAELVFHVGVTPHTRFVASSIQARGRRPGLIFSTSKGLRPSRQHIANLGRQNGRKHGEVTVSHHGQD